MNADQRQRIIDKILDERDDENLFNTLKLDIHDIFIKVLEGKTDDELLEIIL